MKDVQAALEVLSRRVAIPSAVDLDTAMAVALWAHLVRSRVQDLELRFVPAFAVTTLDYGEVGLNLTGGPRAIPYGSFRTLFRMTPFWDRTALWRFAEQVAPERHRYLNLLGPTARLVEAFEQLRQSCRRDEEKQLVLDWSEELFLEQLENGRERRAIETIADSALWLAGNRVAVLPVDSPLGCTSALFRAGAEYVVYQSGMNVGVPRSKVVTHPHLGKLLDPHLPPGFYLAPAGGTVAWGSNSSPRHIPSPLSAIELGELLASKLS